jgi:hypothetical protein
MPDQLSNDIAQARNNRDQGKNNFESWFKNGLTVGLLVIGMIVGYTRLEARVDFNTTRLDRIERVMEDMTNQMAEFKSGAKVRETQYANIKEDLAEIKALLKRRIP